MLIYLLYITLLRQVFSLEIGEIAPDFTLIDQYSSPISLSTLLKNGSVVILFFDKENSTLSTTELLAFQNNLNKFSQLNASVVAITPNTHHENLQFSASNNISFPLLSDIGKCTFANWSVKTALPFLPLRTSYIIDPSGRIYSKHFNLFLPHLHVTTTLRSLRMLVNCETTTHAFGKLSDFPYVRQNKYNGYMLRLFFQKLLA